MDNKLKWKWRRWSRWGKLRLVSVSIIFCSIKYTVETVIDNCNCRNEIDSQYRCVCTSTSTSPSILAEGVTIAPRLNK